MKKQGIIIYLIVMFMVSTALSQDMAVPIDLQYSLFVKILSFDRELMNNSKDSIAIGIAYQGRNPSSRNAKDELIETMNTSTVKQIQGRSVTYIAIDIMSDNLEEELYAKQIDVLYLTPVRAYDIQTVVEICRNADILSISGVPEYCRSGLSVSIGQKGQTPEIFINLEASRAEGSDFSSQLLKLATVL